jgi:Mrp family chromosome partitioning ATPase/predicted Fe-Mo cluster-binding NifX family protein
MQTDLTNKGRVLPGNFGPLRGANGNARITGPCGDTMEFWVFVENGKVEPITYTTDGCLHSILSGTAAAELAQGKTIAEINKIGQTEVLTAVGGLPEESKHCALLAANTLKAAIADYCAKQAKSAGDCERCTDDSCQTKKNRERDHSNEAETEEDRQLKSRLSRIKHKVIVLSGKGGVGKSTVAVNLAVSLMLAGKRVGLLDVDIHGPSVPKMMGLEGTPIQTEMDCMIPVEVGDLKVMSIGLLLRNPNDAVIWRGPMKMGVIKQFLKDVVWGDLDYLIVDAPPGTGDEPLSVCQLLPDADGAVVVTTPQEVALSAVRKSINFCRQLNLRVLGVVENMSGFACPHCGKSTELFKVGGGESMAKEMDVPFLGCIPFDPLVGVSGDAGKPYVHHYARTETAKAFGRVIVPILSLSKNSEANGASSEQTFSEKEKIMRIAIPVAEGKLCLHFGHCEKFALLDVEPNTKKIIKKEEINAPEHQPGLLPGWLAERGATVIIAGGMGSRAQTLFAERGIKVVVGAASDSPETIVNAFLSGKLQAGANICDH